MVTSMGMVVILAGGRRHFVPALGFILTGSVAGSFDVRWKYRLLVGTSLVELLLSKVSLRKVGSLQVYSVEVGSRQMRPVEDGVL